jgi:cell division protein FtsB
MKSMVYVVMRDKNFEGCGDWEFHKVFQKKSLAEQYVSEYNKKAEYNALEIISTEFADTEFFIEKNKNKPYVEKKNNAELKWEHKQLR